MRKIIVVGGITAALAAGGSAAAMAATSAPPTFCVRYGTNIPVYNWNSQPNCPSGYYKLAVTGKPGPQGPAGPQGPTGSQGPAGPKGDTGPAAVPPVVHYFLQIPSDPSKPGGPSNPVVTVQQICSLEAGTGPGTSEIPAYQCTYAD